MADFNDPVARPRPLQREEALEMATDLLVKNPVGMGNGNVFFASNISWLIDFTLNLEPSSEDLHYLITAGENFYSQATPEQKDTKTFAECARMLAVAYNHVHEDWAKIVYYQECASRCLEVKEKLDKNLPDALVSFEKLLQQEDSRFPELVSVADSALTGAKFGSDRAAQWSVVAGLAQLHAGDRTAAEAHYRIASASEVAQKGTGYARLQKELKISVKKEKAKAGGSFLKKLNPFGRSPRA
jgi:hypothetical protein